MKKASALTMLALFGALTMNAQDGKSVRFGLKASPNFGWFASDDATFSNDGSKLGFSFGLMGDFMIGSNQNYAFSTGIMYTTSLGAKYAQAYKTTVGSVNTTVASTGDMSLAYVQLPITMKLKTNEIGYMTYYGQIGADLGVNVGAHADQSITTTVVDGSSSSVSKLDVTNNDISGLINPLRVGLIVGIGAEYNFSGNTSAMLGLTYGNGFTNAFDSDFGSKAKLHYFELSLGVFF